MEHHEGAETDQAPAQAVDPAVHIDQFLMSLLQQAQAPQVPPAEAMEVDGHAQALGPAVMNATFMNQFLALQAVQMQQSINRTNALEELVKQQQAQLASITEKPIEAVFKAESLPSFDGTNSKVSYMEWWRQCKALIPPTMSAHKKVETASRRLGGAALSAWAKYVETRELLQLTAPYQVEDLLNVLGSEPFSRPSPPGVYIKKLQRIRVLNSADPLNALRQYIVNFELLCDSFDRSVTDPSDKLRDLFKVHYFLEGLTKHKLHAALLSAATNGKYDTYSALKESTLNLSAQRTDLMDIDPTASTSEAGPSRDDNGRRGLARAAAGQLVQRAKNRQFAVKAGGVHKHNAGGGNGGPKPVLFPNQRGEMLDGKARSAFWEHKQCWYCEGTHAARDCEAMPADLKQKFQAHAASVAARKSNTNRGRGVRGGGRHGGRGGRHNNVANRAQGMDTCLDVQQCPIHSIGLACASTAMCCAEAVSPALQAETLLSSPATTTQSELCQAFSQVGHVVTLSCVDNVSPSLCTTTLSALPADRTSDGTTCVGVDSSLERGTAQTGTSLLDALRLKPSTIKPNKRSQNTRCARRARAKLADAYALSGPLDPLNHMFLKRPIFDIIQHNVGVQFTLDGCADTDGRNSQCSNYCTPTSSFLSTELRGEHVWLHTPLNSHEPFVDHFLTQYAADGTNTCTVLLPDQRAIADYMQSKEVFHKVLTLPIYSDLFLAPDKLTGEYKDLPACHWPYAVWHCPQNKSLSQLLLQHNKHQAAESNSVLLSMGAKALLFHLDCKVFGHTATAALHSGTVLFDTGAKLTAVVSKAYCDRIGVTVRTAVTDIQLANGVNAPCLGTAELKLKLHSQTFTVQAHVLELAEQFDLIIGEDFLLHTKAVLDYGAKTLTLHHKHKRVTLNCRDPMRDGCNAATKPVRKKQLLNAAQVKRSTRKGERMFLFYVKPVEASHTGADTPDRFDNAVTTTLQHKQQLVELLRRYAAVFPEKPVPFGEFAHKRPDPLEVVPLVPGAKVPLRPLFRYSPTELDEMKRQVTELLELGYVEVSSSPFGAPILFVLKKDGSWRMCVDYRALNNATISNTYPIPRIDDLIDSLGKATVFTSLDLLAGYHQLPLSHTDSERSAFRTPFGTFAYRVLPFGLKNAPSVFQRTMNKLLSSHLGRYCVVYLDDILIYSPDTASHLQHLEAVLKTLQENSFYAKLSKCSFMFEELKYLGFVVGKDGLKVDPAKTEVINTWPLPKNLTELRSFLGLANQFRRFIQGFATITLPLQSLLSPKTKWPNPLPADAVLAFEQLKAHLTSAPCLTLPNYNLPFTIVADASDFAWGSVLLQQGRPVAFLSKAFSDAETRYTTTEKELLAVVNSVKTWRCYLEGQPVTLCTDHCPNTFFSTQPLLSRRQARWMETLSLVHHKWEYKAGRLNVADPLSRNPAFLNALGKLDLTSKFSSRSCNLMRPSWLSGCVGSVRRFLGVMSSASNPAQQPDLVKLLQAAYASDAYLQSTADKPDLHMYDAVWYYKTKLYVPTSVVPTVLQFVHDSPQAGHTGVLKTMHAVKRRFWWPSWRADVKLHVKGCHYCQIDKPKREEYGLLAPLPIPDSPWHTVTMDFITQLPPSGEQKFDAIMVVVDKLTKYAHFIPTFTIATAEYTAKLYYDNVFVHHGFPAVWVTDRDSKFTSAFWQQLTTYANTDHRLSTAFHPQTDGQTEVTNKTLETYLRHYVSPLQDNWASLLSTAQFCYNSTWHESLASTPFEVTYGYLPRSFLDVALLPVLNPAAHDFVTTRDTLLQLAKTALHAAQQRYKKFADEHRTDLCLSIGDQVLLSTKNIKFKALGVQKLFPKFIGPYNVVKQVGKCSYQLHLPASLGRMHDVFHVSLLKPYIVGHNQPTLPATVEIEGETEYWIEKILTHRVVKRGRSIKREYLIRWRGTGPDDDTWEPEANLTSDYKVFNDMLQAYWLTMKKAEHKRAQLPSALLDADLFESLPVAERLCTA